jgi:hypothetical protein
VVRGCWALRRGAPGFDGVFGVLGVGGGAAGGLRGGQSNALVFGGVPVCVVIVGTGSFLLVERRTAGFDMRDPFLKIKKTIRFREPISSIITKQ